LIDKNDPCFEELSDTCDSVAQQLLKDGVGASVKHAAIVTPDWTYLFCDLSLTVYVSLIFDQLSGFCRCYWLITCLVYTAN